MSNNRKFNRDARRTIAEQMIQFKEETKDFPFIGESEHPGEDDILKEMENQNIEDLITQELGIELTDDEKLEAMAPSRVPAPFICPPEFSDKGDMRPVNMNHIYDTRTGISVATEEVLKDNTDLIDADVILSHFMNNDSINEDGLKNILSSSYKIDMNNEASAGELLSIMNLVNDHLNGKELKNVFKNLPPTFQNIITNQTGRGSSIKISYLNTLAKELIHNIASEYIKEDDSADLDKMIAQINEYSNELNKEIGALQGQIHTDIVSKSIKTIKQKMEEAIESGDTEKAQEWKNIYEGMTETIDLALFKEFCKRSKAKHYELERPDKVFSNFNQKYYDHKLNIYDIRSCVGVLDSHFKDHTEDYGNLKLCIIFCKYCLNMSPNNAKEHAFMYYFIKNIIVMNLICTNGSRPIVEEGNELSKESLEFYDTFSSNLRECIDNIR